MLNNYVATYYSKCSNVHKMHPLSKIICTFLFLVITLISFDIKIIFGLIIFLFLIIINTNIKLKIYYNVIYNLKITLFTFFVLISLITLSPLLSLLLTIKLILIINFINILTLTTPTTEIIYGLELFLKPLTRFNIKINVLALNIGLSLRFVSILIDTKNDILTTQISRGIDYRKNLNNFIFAIKSLVKPAFKITYQKTKELKNSMIIRLYSIDKERCNFRMNNWGLFDNILILILSILFLTILLKGVI